MLILILLRKFPYSFILTESNEQLIKILWKCDVFYFGKKSLLTL